MDQTFESLAIGGPSANHKMDIDIKVLDWTMRKRNVKCDISENCNDTTW